MPHFLALRHPLPLSIPSPVCRGRQQRLSQGGNLTFAQGIFASQNCLGKGGFWFICRIKYYFLSAKVCADKGEINFVEKFHGRRIGFKLFSTVTTITPLQTQSLSLRSRLQLKRAKVSPRLQTKDPHVAGKARRGEGILKGRGCRRARKCGMFAFSRTRPSSLKRLSFGYFPAAVGRKVT